MTVRAITHGLTVAVFVVAGLSFAFGFGNGWALGLRLGVPAWIAPLVAPAVDLSVVVLLASMQYLRVRGINSGLVGPRWLLVFCGLVTLALNTAHPLLEADFGRAAFDAIAPLLLIGWSEVGPGLLASLHTVPDDLGPSSSTKDDQDDELLAVVRQLDAAHLDTHGRGITRDRLRAQLKVSNAVAGELLRRVRSESTRPKEDSSRRTTST